MQAPVLRRGCNGRQQQQRAAAKTTRAKPWSSSNRGACRRGRLSVRVTATATTELASPSRPAEHQEVEMSEEKKDIQRLMARPYKYGFKTIIESDTFPKGLDEEVVRCAPHILLLA